MSKSQSAAKQVIPSFEVQFECVVKDGEYLLEDFDPPTLFKRSEINSIIKQETPYVQSPVMTNFGVHGLEPRKPIEVEHIDDYYV